MVIVDAHTHLFSPSQRENRESLCERDTTFAEMYADPKSGMATLDLLLPALEKAGAAWAVAAGFAFAAESDLAAQNEYLLESTAASDGRVAPLATVNPALPGWDARARDSLESGARGFGELRPHSQGWDPCGPAGDALCELAETQNAVLLWHVSERVGHSYPGKAGGIAAEELAVLAARHPSTRMIAAHLGAGLPFFLQMPELRKGLGNVWFDTAAHSLLYDDKAVARVVGLAGAPRVLFGSDYPLLSPRRQLARISAVLSEDEQEAVCGGNAVTLFSDSPKR